MILQEGSKNRVLMLCQDMSIQNEASLIAGLSKFKIKFPVNPIRSLSSVSAEISRMHMYFDPSCL